MFQRIDGLSDVGCLAEDRVEPYPLRHPGDLRQHAFDAVDDRDGVGAALLENRDVDRTLSVDAHDVLLDLGSVLGVANVAHVNGLLPFPNLDRNVVDIIRVVDHRVAVNEVVLRADLRVARRDDQVRAVERMHHVHRGQPTRLQRVVVDVDHDLPILTPEWRRDGGALHRGEPVADVELSLIT